MTINFRNDLGRTSIKKSTTHIQSSKLFNGRLVWHLNIHTLLKVLSVAIDGKLRMEMD